MGIRGLAKFLGARFPGALTSATLRDLAGAVVAVDASIQLHQAAHAIGGADSAQRIALWPLLNRAKALIEHRIMPIYVFDGVPPEEKARREGGLHIGAELIDAFKAALDILGIPRVDAPREADEYLAALSRMEIARTIISEDLDPLAMGAASVMTGFRVSPKPGEMIEYSLPAILRALELTPDQFVDFCAIIGTDYAPRVPGYGPARALRAIQAPPANAPQPPQTAKKILAARADDIRESCLRLAAQLPSIRINRDREAIAARLVADIGLAPALVARYAQAFGPN